MRKLIVVAALLVMWRIAESPFGYIMRTLRDNQRRAAFLAEVAISFALIISSLTLVPVVGFSLFPKAGTPQFLVNIETAEGTSMAATDSVAKVAEKLILKHPNTRGIFTNVGKDNPFIYYNVVPRAEAGNIAQLFVLQHGFETEAAQLLERLELIYPNRHFPVIGYPPSLAVHVGPKALGVIVYEGTR